MAKRSYRTIRAKRRYKLTLEVLGQLIMGDAQSCAELVKSTRHSKHAVCRSLKILQAENLVQNFAERWDWREAINNQTKFFITNRGQRVLLSISK